MFRVINIFISLLVIVSLLSCSSVKRVSFHDTISKYKCTRLVKYKMRYYSNHGFHSYSDFIAEKPTLSKSMYHIVCENKSGKPLISYHVGVIGPRNKENEFVKIVYKSSKYGFKIAFEGLKGTSSSAKSIEGVLAELALKLVIVVGFGVGGFIVGVVRGSIVEMQHLGLSNKEMILGYCTYDYDTEGRMVKIVYYAPSKNVKKLSWTRFYYKMKIKIPFKTINYNGITKKQRIIYGVK